MGGTWRNPPFNIESLTYQVVPEVGGHTLWADLQAAYDGLSEPVKELLESVSAVYSAYPGDFVLWDNLATWHYAVNDYDGPRVYRKVIAG